MLTALTAVLVLLGLFGLAQTIRPSQRPSFAAIAPSSPPRTPAQQARPRSSASELTLAFAGDVHFEGRVEARLADPGSTLGPISAVLSRADLAMVNLETAITDRGSPEPKEFFFRAPPSVLQALRLAGVDVATMANNHGVDFGGVGLQDTLAAVRSSGFPVIGIGRSAAQAYAPWYATVRGHRVAILAASQIRDHTLTAWTASDNTGGIASAYSDRLLAAVRAARQRAEVVVVYLHWGAEGEACPLPVQRELAQRLAEAGADAVVGTHAHLLLGAGWLGKTYVGYGLGNFLWWRDNAYSNQTGVLTLTFRGRRAVAATLTPAVIDERGVPMPVTGSRASQVLATWSQATRCSGLAPRASS